MSAAQSLSPSENSHSPISEPLATRTGWQIDPKNSRVEFTIRKRLLLAPLRVTGRFSDVQGIEALVDAGYGVITLDEQDPTTAQANVTIGARSIDTGNARRDTHLHQADFFHVDTHPAITFRSRRVDSIDRSAGRYTVLGELTVRGVTREVLLDAYYSAPEGSGNNRRVKLSLTTTLNRRDFGLVWNTLFISVAGDLTVNLEIEATPAQ